MPYASHLWFPPRATRRAAAILLTALAACRPEAGTATAGETETGEAPAATTGEASTAATTEAPTTGASTGEPTTGEATSSSTGDTGAAEDTDDPGGYCWDFHVSAPAPYLELYDKDGTPLADGVTLPLECGGQGLWMFGLYPDFGGWDPMDKGVDFALTVDVEGFNTGPSGHFYKGVAAYYIGCENLDGGVPGVVPIFPPDELADLSLLDGATAQVHVEIDAAGELVTFDATLPLSAPKALVEKGCVFSP